MSDFTSYHVDALAARFVTAPETLDVVVASNLFGDILTDLGGALQGSLGLPASANLNPERIAPEHVRAGPRLGAGTRRPGRRQPDGGHLGRTLLLRHLGEAEAADLVMSALRRVALNGPRTRDLGGTATTVEVGAAIAAAIA